MTYIEKLNALRLKAIVDSIKEELLNMLDQRNNSIKIVEYVGYAHGDV